MLICCHGCTRCTMDLLNKWRLVSGSSRTRSVFERSSTTFLFVFLSSRNCFRHDLIRGLRRPLWTAFVFLSCSLGSTTLVLCHYTLDLHSLRGLSSFVSLILWFFVIVVWWSRVVSLLCVLGDKSVVSAFYWHIYDSNLKQLVKFVNSFIRRYIHQ